VAAVLLPIRALGGPLMTDTPPPDERADAVRRLGALGQAIYAAAAVRCCARELRQTIGVTS